MDWKIKWTKETLDYVIDNCCLNEFQADILTSRVHCMTVKEMCYFYHCSESKIYAAIRLIAERYDALQAQHPEILNPRCTSAQEEYMNKN